MSEKSGGRHASHPRYAYRYPRNWISRFFLAQRHRYVRSIVHNSKNLDVGCGEHKITSESVGVDLRAGRRPDIFCSVLSLPFAERSFQTCTMLEVIEHMDEEKQRRALGEVRRVLDDQGQFILSTPNMVHGLFRVVWWFWERTVGREWFHEHVGMLDPKEVEALLLGAGFALVSNRRVAVFDRIMEARKSP